MRRFQSEKGFTLVEIMIVVTILALLAAIAIPGLLRARHNANEATVIGDMKLIRDSMENFRTIQTPNSYPSALTDLSGAAPPYIDTILASGTKHGYIFTYTSGTNTYSVVASPATPSVTGTRVFFVNESGVIRLDDSAGNPI